FFRLNAEKFFCDGKEIRAGAPRTQRRTLLCSVPTPTQEFLSTAVKEGRPPRHAAARPIFSSASTLKNFLRRKGNKGGRPVNKAPPFPLFCSTPSQEFLSTAVKRGARLGMGRRALFCFRSESF
ncbi:MAG: hypothetical protein IJ668_08945, partial [Selenomonadaceae bacterium]|nr:hypothetical protein [Selenomonadaceae bacterium]